MKLAETLFTRNNIFFLFCLVGFTINFMAFYPGFLSSDSIGQYAQTLSGVYDTWHPTILAFTWRMLEKIYKGPQLMLALQLFFLWGGCFFIGISLRNWFWRILIFLLFLLSPFIYNFAGWVVKDTIMAFSWLLAASIMFKHILHNQKCSVITAMATALLLLYGTWMRYNAIVALPALSIAWAWMVFNRRSITLKLVAAIALVLVVHWGQNFFNNVILKAQKMDTEVQIYFHDLAGVYVKYNKNYFPNVLYDNPGFDTTYMKEHYNQVDVTVLLWNSANKNFLQGSDKYNITEELKKAWIKMIKNEPGLYLKHRMDIYEYFLTLKKEGELQYHFVWMVPNDYGFKIDDKAPLYRMYAESLIGQENRIYFQVWFWVFLNVLLFPLFFLVKSKVHRLYYLCIVAAGFLYTLPQFFVANTVRDFRYIYWSCFSCIIAILFIIASRVLNRKKAHVKA